MASRIPDHILAEVRDKTAIEDVIGRYVSLKRRGANQIGLCPFHSEKTPSFNVNPARQGFYCFGCHEKGDVFGFLMKIEGKGFLEVVRELAEEAGVPLPRRELSPAEQQRETEREQCLRVNQLAMRFFQRQLSDRSGRPAQDYIAGRSLDAAVVESFALGFAPESWDALARLLQREKVPAALAVKLGLVAVKRKAAERPDATAGLVDPRKQFDFFRERLMFPVIGAGGSVLGFSGRLLDPEAKERKYVNSPENPVYHKSEILYGLPQARPAMRRAERAVLVEGNVDVLALHQAGFPETVAPLGTALTTRQVAVLRRFVDQVVLAYDGDNAGQTAARKGAEMLAGEEVMARIAVLPKGSDPADLAERQPDELRRVLEGAVAGPAFLIDAVAREMGDTVEERVRAAETLAPILGRIKNPVVRDEYFQHAAAAIGLRPEQVQRAVRGQRQAAVTSRRNQPRRGAESAAPRTVVAPAVPTDEASFVFTLLALLTAHPLFAPRVAKRGLPSFLTDEMLRDLVRSAVESQASSGMVDTNALLEQVPESLQGSLATELDSHAYRDDELDASQAVEQTLDRLQEAWLGRKLKGLAAEIKEAGAQGRTEERTEMIRRHQELQRERRELLRR